MAEPPTMNNLYWEDNANHVEPPEMSEEDHSVDEDCDHMYCEMNSLYWEDDCEE